MKKQSDNNVLLGCSSVIVMWGLGIVMFLGFWGLVIYLLVWLLRYLQVIN